MKSIPTLVVLCATLIPASLLCVTAPVVKDVESWTNLSLEGSELKPIPPLLGQVDTQPAFRREFDRLQWRIKDPIDTFMVLPKSAPKPPVIIYLYNYTTNTDRFMHNNVCQSLTKGGAAAVGFSTALSGQRFHDRGLTEWFVSDLQEALATSTHDVELMINYLETRNDLDTSRIGIYGQGSGAAVAILAAYTDPRIKVLDLEDAWGDWPVWLAKSSIIPESERPSYLKPGFLKNVSGLDPVDYLSKLKIPLRSQYSMATSPVPPEVRKRMEAALPPQSVHTPVQANFDWINKELREMPSSPAAGGTEAKSSKVSQTK